MTRCRKIKYRDRVAAELALALLRRKDGSRRKRTETRAYRCQACHSWHLTSKPGK